MYQLRDYQTSLVSITRDAFRTHRRVLMQAPTGSGKTVMFAFVTSGAIAKGNRVIVAAHRNEIVTQISQALDAIGVRHGRIQPNHEPTDDLCQVAMIQTLARRIGRIEPPDFLIIDEAHHAVSDTYQIPWPNTKILGVTATPERLDGRGLKHAFDTMVLGPPTAELIAQDWLARYIYLAPPSEIDLSHIHTRAGDYAIDEIAAEVDKAVITGDAIEHYREHLAGRSAIAFTVRVDHAEHVAEQFQAAGIRAASVDGSMDGATRRDRIEGLGNGKYQVLTSCALISEGLDVPSVGGVILLRPTKSLALHLQQIGRALRPKPDGSPAIILDHVGNVLRHGLPDAHRDWTLEDRKRKPEGAPVSQCKVCYRFFNTFPKWREVFFKSVEAGDEVDCEHPEHSGCLLRLVPEPTEITAPEVVEGKLVRVAGNPEWAKGCNLLTARGQEWLALLKHADTRDKLDEIRRVRGYHPAWVRHAMSKRR